MNFFSCILRAGGRRRVDTLAPLTACVVLCGGCASTPKPTTENSPIPPKSYDCRRVETPPVIDGRLDDPAWTRAPWTDTFVDIEGPSRPSPHFGTRVKMAWDDGYLYVAARLDEPHVWGTLTQFDSIIYNDNDFEIFIDPLGDAVEYYEIEINALGTQLDLYLHTPYSRGGSARIDWNCIGLRSAVAVEGTINDPTDVDRAWTLEWAIPWDGLRPPRYDTAWEERDRCGRPPSVGDEWKINFSRVQWDHVVDSTTQPPTYRRVPGRPEHNWVWTPQWRINMHLPEHWGRVRFVDDVPR